MKKILLSPFLMLFYGWIANVQAQKPPPVPHATNPDKSIIVCRAVGDHTLNSGAQVPLMAGMQIGEWFVFTLSYDPKRAKTLKPMFLYIRQDDNKKKSVFHKVPLTAQKRFANEYYNCECDNPVAESNYKLSCFSADHLDGIHGGEGKKGKPFKHIVFECKDCWRDKRYILELLVNGKVERITLGYMSGITTRP